MLKRRASTIVTCPGCKTKFDAETRVRLVGSCGHSICSICANEKKITTCPVCKDPGSFLWKQKNELATEPLAIPAVNKAKRARLQLTEKPIPAILDSENRFFLPQIVNQLDPNSFLKFSRTCKEIHKFCFKTKEIKIIHDNLRLRVHIDRRGPIFKLSKRCQPWTDRYVSQNYRGKRGKFLDYRKNRQKLRKYPFLFKLQSLITLKSLNSQLLDSIRSFLAEFPVMEISRIKPRLVSDWSGFTRFVKDFHLRKVEVYSCYGNEAMPDETMTWFLQNSEIELHTDLPVADELILDSPLNVLDLLGASISKETFETLLLRCVNSTEELQWTLGCSQFEFGYRNVFKEALPFDHEGRLSEERPLVFFKENEPTRFYVLRKDGKVVDCHKSIDVVCFSLLNPSEYPSCLKTNYSPVA